MGGRRYVLTVLVRGTVQEHVLPSSGRVTMGRDPGCEVTAFDPSVSRRHAVIEVAGDDVTIADLGSANGVRIAREGTAAETAKASDGLAPEKVPVRITEKDCVYVGNVMCTLRREAVSPAGIDGVRRLATQAAQSDIPVLLLGETGVGKEVFAEAIHAQSPRSRGPLVRLHCAALAESLLESELFGHVKGAFTGALRDRVGLIESAEGGTLFLDEIGELPLATQVKLLRVLEDHSVLRVGANATRKVDFRLVAATNRDLEEESSKGAFRRDLFYRISGFVLRIPPLRDRRSEIPVLAEALLSDLARMANRAVPSLTAAAVASLQAHVWPGNVRELRRVLERALVLAPGARIDPEHLLVQPASETARSTGGAGAGAFRDDVEAYERARIESALADSDGNQTRAAQSLGMPRRTLVAKLAKMGIRPKPD